MKEYTVVYNVQLTKILKSEDDIPLGYENDLKEMIIKNIEKTADFDNVTANVFISAPMEV